MLYATVSERTGTPDLYFRLVFLPGSHGSIPPSSGNFPRSHTVTATSGALSIPGRDDTPRLDGWPSSDWGPRSGGGLAPFTVGRSASRRARWVYRLVILNIDLIRVSYRRCGSRPSSTSRLDTPDGDPGVDDTAGLVALAVHRQRVADNRPAAAVGRTAPLAGPRTME